MLSPFALLALPRFRGAGAARITPKNFLRRCAPKKGTPLYGETGQTPGEPGFSPKRAFFFGSPRAARAAGSSEQKVAKKTWSPKTARTYSARTCPVLHVTGLYSDPHEAEKTHSPGPAPCPPGLCFGMDFQLCPRRRGIVFARSPFLRGPASRAKKRQTHTTPTQRRGAPFAFCPPSRVLGLFFCFCAAPFWRGAPRRGRSRAEDGRGRAAAGAGRAARATP